VVSALHKETRTASCSNEKWKKRKKNEKNNAGDAGFKPMGSWSVGQLLWEEEGGLLPILQWVVMSGLLFFS
jgi:hypothetical protein